MKVDELTSEELRNAAKMLGISTGRKGDKKIKELIEAELAKLNDSPEVDNSSDLDELEPEVSVSSPVVKVNKLSRKDAKRKGRHPITGKEL